MSRLTDFHIRNWIKAKNPIAKSFGNGLTFTLSAKGTATWVLRYRFRGKQRELTIGHYPEFSIKRATEDAFRRRIEIAGGIDVAREKQQLKRKLQLGNTVLELGNIYFADFEQRGRSIKSRRWHLGVQR